MTPPQLVNILDASDCLNRARDIVQYMIKARTRTRDDDPGESWILAEVQTGILDALALLNTAVPANPEPQ